MSDTRYRRNAGSVFSLKYHFVWCPKYRRKVLVGEIADELRSLLHQKAQEMDATIEALEIMPDHVHLFIQSDPTEAPQRLANQFKGYTSRRLREKFPQLRSRLPSLWSRSYYVGTIGQVSEETVKRYIEMQRSSIPSTGHG
jgi:putative transposase